MPVYEYECTEHGVFEQLRSLSEYAAPAPCPTCTLDAPRVMSVPHLCGVPRATLIARERNERSSHEPRVAHKCNDHGQAGKAPASRPPLKQYTGARPWVIEHG